MTEEMHYVEENFPVPLKKYKYEGVTITFKEMYFKVDINALMPLVWWQNFLGDI